MSKYTTYLIANWKMQMSRADAHAFAQQLRPWLFDIDLGNNNLIICPSFPILAELVTTLRNSDAHVGAQNCSAHAAGAHTGQVSAALLKEIGCTYAIIGHSERRNELNESPALVAKKATRLLEEGIDPIICIGERKEQYEQGNTNAVLEQQLAPIIPVLAQFGQAVCIAYEPVWAIGTGLVPTTQELETTFSWLADHLKSALSEPHISLLYGGSVKANNAAEILAVPHIAGLLIGGASCDFQSLQKIVSLTL